MGFEVGKLLARIQLEGAATFGRDLQSIGAEFGALDEKGRQSSERIGRSLLSVGAAIIALAGLAVARFAEFDRAMSEAGAVVDGFSDSQDRLRKAALDAGAVTVYTATEAAHAQAELGKAGISASQILGGALTGSLSLAAAGQLEVADAAGIAAIAMTQFRLSGEEIPHLADLLAAGANKAQGSVTDLSFALKQSGLVASQMGLSVEETIGTLSAFASAGLLGSDAGTSFRQMLLNLATPTKQQSALMEQYNIRAYENGKFVGIAALAQQLHSGELAKATQEERDHALGVIFGSDAIRAANVLYRQGGQGIADWTAKVDDAGAAARIAGQLQNNLAGDVEKLGGAFDSALIGTGEGANGVLRDMVQWLTTLVDGYADLDPGVQQFILAAGITTGVVALLGGAFLIAVPKVVEFRLALQTLNTQVPALQGALGRAAAFLTGPWGIALALGAIGLQMFNKWVEDSKPSADELTASLAATNRTAETIFATFAKGNDGLVNAAVSFDRIQEAINAVDDSNNPFAFFLDDDLNRVFSTLRDIGEEMGTIAKTDLSSAQASYRMLAEQTDGTAESQWRLLNGVQGYKEALIAIATEQGTYNETMSETQKRSVLIDLAQGDAAASTTEAADAYLNANEEASGLQQTLEELISTLDTANNTNRDAITANIDYQDTLRDVDEAIRLAREGQEGYALTLDVGTEAGARNMGMLVDLSESAWDAAEAQLALDGDTGRFIGTLTASRDALIQRAIDLGYNAEEAQALADSILNIPTEREARIIAETAAAQSAVDSFINRNNGREVRLGVGMYANKTIPIANGGEIRQFANGGEHHVAQFAAGGTMRVWAEPETGGEWYMPDSPAKRQRSLALAQKMLNGWGYEAIPLGGGGGGGSRGSVSVSFVNPVVRDLDEEARHAVDIVKAGLSV